MEKVVLWKRAKKGGNPMSAPWVESANEDTAPSNSEIAHSYAEHIGHEYARLRARLHKLEAKADAPDDTNQLRKAEPHLTREQAFEKAYTDPKHANLRRIERNAFYKSIDYDCL